MFKIFLGLLSVFIFAKAASADSTACYRFKMQESAEKTSIPNLQTQTWCYRQLSSPAGAVVVFDGENIRPELSAVVEADGTVTHGSLSKGQVSTHKVNASDINPLPVPLTEPTDMAPLSGEAARVDGGKVNEVLSFLSGSRPEVRALSVEEGVFTAAIPQINQPWRGYWWPFKGERMAGGVNSPLAKYDRYVRSRTGVSPQTRSWELANHRYSGAWWGGHCNGWAASAVLRAEPRRAKYHAPSAVTFSVGDQKGILAEEDFCARISFYGKRNYGRPGNDPRDIYPAEFHRVVSYYVGQLGKLVAIDYLSSPVVDTHLISGYTFNIRREGANRFLVTANLKVHKYDRSPDIAPGIAPTYTRTYRYRLTTNASGQAISGTWLSANPDFLWVPLSPVDCSSNNPRMRVQFVNEILNLREQ